MIDTLHAVLEQVRQAYPDTFERGLRWYQDAHAHACRIAQATGFPVSNAAAVIAIVSPNVRWETNLKAAETFLSEVRDGKSPAEIRIPTYKRNKHVAYIALFFSDPSVLFDERSCPKVRAFYRNILDPSDPEPVTIDRHMHRLWLALSGEHMPRLTLRRYRLIASTVRAVARRSGLVPCEAQAILWLAWKEARDAFEPHVKGEDHADDRAAA
jgi:hypothetical protein